MLKKRFAIISVLAAASCFMLSLGLHSVGEHFIASCKFDDAGEGACHLGAFLSNTGALFLGSSPNSGEGCADLEEEVDVIPKAVSHALDDFDAIIDTLNEVGAERISAVSQNAGQVRSKCASEASQRFDATA